VARVGTYVGERLHGLLGLAGALAADRVLQRACRLLEAGELQARELLAGEAEVDQAAVAGELLAAQRELGVERMPFGGERVAALRAERAAVAPGFASAREHGLDRRHAHLAGADLGLCALGAGARGDEQAVGLVEAAAPVGERGLLFGEALLEAGERGVGGGRRDRRGRRQRGELATRLGDLCRCVGECLLERIEPAAMVVGAGEAGLGLFQRLLRGALLGLGQLAVRERLRARAQLVRLRPWRRLGGGPGGQQRKQEQEEDSDQRAHREDSVGVAGDGPAGGVGRIGVHGSTGSRGRSLAGRQEPGARGRMKASCRNICLNGYDSPSIVSRPEEMENDKMDYQIQRLKVLGAGIFSLMLALGVARFAYTPLLPLMQAQAGLGLAEGGWLAAINYTGYLSGALLAASISDLMLKDRLYRIGMLKDRLYRIGMVVAVLTTLMMGLTTDFTVWAVSRYLAGLSSAAAMLLGTGLILNWLIRHNHRHELGIHFAGIGLGIAGCSVAVALMSLWLDWRAQWFVFTAIACVLLVPALRWLPAPDTSGLTRSGAPMHDDPPSPLFLRIFMASYFCATSVPASASWSARPSSSPSSIACPGWRARGAGAFSPSAWRRCRPASCGISSPAVPAR